MLGREVHQPQDIWSGTAELKPDWVEAPNFLYNLTEALKEAQNTAREHLRMAQEHQKKTYDGSGRRAFLQCWRFGLCKG